MERLELDRTAMVIRSIGDTPGVATAVTAQTPDQTWAQSGPGHLMVDPGGTHPFAFIPGDVAIEASADPITTVALTLLAGSAFGHSVIQLADGQMYGHIASLAARHEEFAVANSAHMACAVRADVRRSITGELCETQDTAAGQPGAATPQDVRRTILDLADLDALFPAAGEQMELEPWQRRVLRRLRGGSR